MHLLHVVDLGNNHVQVSWRRDAAIPRIYPYPIPFTDPLTAEDRSELRWYLEDYLQFPYGAEEYRAQQVEQKMAEWGESLFRQVFIKTDADPDPRVFYREAVREELGYCELCITSEEPTFLNIPWELMRDPTPGRGYLALLLAGLYRQRSSHKIEVPPEISPHEPFRILLVIARPYGERDIPLGTVARPMLQALRPLRPRIQLEILRPPTFDELQQHLNDRPGYYHLVHFDGHGVFAHTSSGGSLMHYGALAGHGHLIFERDDGTEHIVNSQELGQVLAKCKVPLFVLNACQSAEGGQIDPFSSVASQLVAVGAQGVVAMSYSVYASAAALFIERFYERLMKHATLSEAVADARRRLCAEPHRESVVGSLELRDWVVPTLYQQEFQYVPIPEGSVLAVAEEKAEESGLRRRAEDTCPEGRFGFIGRDYDLLRLERALRDNDAPWALITGIGGVGKTELAYGFARWYAETGGCPGGVFATSFKASANFGQVIGSIVGYGTDFSRLSDEEQWQRLVAYLREKACLLVWDNFETVAGYPSGEVPLATNEERAKLARFLKALQSGKSRVIITTRKPDESWLGIAYNLAETRGLNERDAAQMAKTILKTVGRRPEDFRTDADYVRLIRLLKGHPRSLEVVLPQLQNRSPTEIIETLQHRVDKLSEAIEDASLAEAFAHLSPKARKHLPFVGLFVSLVYAGTLGAFSSSVDGQQPVYAEVMGRALSATEWETLLDEAVHSGLIRALGQQVYELHPTLPVFLRRQLVLTVGEDDARKLETEFMKFYAALSASCFKEVKGSQQAALALLALEESSLLRALRIANRHEQWRMVGSIAQTLLLSYRTRNRVDEWRAVRTYLLDRVGKEAPTDRDQADLWMLLLGTEAEDALERNELAVAESAHHRIIEYLISLHDPMVESKIAVAYRHLGKIALRRRQLDEAREWFYRAVAITESLGLELDSATAYGLMGIVAHEQRQLPQAEQWHRKALEIYARLGQQIEVAGTYHELGMIAYERRLLDQAYDWHWKALETFAHLGLERDAAGEYHQLGILAQEMGQIDIAERWHRASLAIRERLGLQLEVAAGYHELGIIASKQQKYDLAEQWHHKALEIKERLGYEEGAALDYRCLAIIAHEKHQLEEAKQWFRKALEIEERLGLTRNAAADLNNLAMIASEQQEFDEAEQLYRSAKIRYESLGLDQQVAAVYDHLAIIAYKRRQFEQAKQWSLKALEIYQQLSIIPMMVTLLARIGDLERHQNHLQEAVSWFGRALTIAMRYRMRISERIIRDIAHIMKVMGEEKFRVAWQQAFNQEPPLALIREMLEQINSEA